MPDEEQGIGSAEVRALRSQFEHLAHNYATRVVDEVFQQRVGLFDAAMADPQRLWRGELGALPATQHGEPESAPSHSSIDNLMAGGLVAVVVALMNRRWVKERVACLHVLRSSGDLRHFISLATETCPGIDHPDAVTLARQLLEAELVALAHIDLPSPLSETFIASIQPNIGRLRYPSNATIPASPRSDPLSMDDLVALWRREAMPSASTLSTWGGHSQHFSLFFGPKAYDLASITPHDMVRWKNQLVQEGKAASTISRSYLGFARAMFRFAVANKLLTFDPSEGIKVSGKAKAGRKMLAYSSDEVTRLLRYAERAHVPWKRWLLPLATATGARIGELAQLHGSHIGVHNGVTVINIRPTVDGGSVKNVASERFVPVHEALLTAGFMAFVAARGTGPLFYDRTSGDPTKKHASKAVTNRLAAWIRQLGFRDARKAPNHAIRHWFKTECARLKIEDSIVDAIQGHSDSKSASVYRHISLEMMGEAINRIRMPPDQ